MQRTWAAQDFAEENDMSIQEAECQIDIGLFLDAYPWWGVRDPIQSIILHEMFLHAAKEGGKRWNVWSTGAAGAACMTLIMRQTNLPWN